MERTLLLICDLFVIAMVLLLFVVIDPKWPFTLALVVAGCKWSYLNDQRERAERNRRKPPVVVPTNRNDS